MEVIGGILWEMQNHHIQLQMKYWCMYPLFQRRLEANSLSLGQVRDVINGKVVFGEQKEIQEVKMLISAWQLTGI